MEYLYHLQWVMEQDDYFIIMINNLILRTGAKVFFPYFDYQYTELMPDFERYDPLNLSVIAIED